MKSDRVRRARRNNAPPLVVEENMGKHYEPWLAVRSILRAEPISCITHLLAPYTSLARPIELPQLGIQDGGECEPRNVGQQQEGGQRSIRGLPELEGRPACSPEEAA